MNSPYRRRIVGLPQPSLGGRPIPYKFYRPLGAPPGFRMVVPDHLPPGMQNCRARVKMRLATCREVGCAAERCRTLHKLPNWEAPLYEYQTGGETRLVTESEFIDRLQEGTYTLEIIRTRGL